MTTTVKEEVLNDVIQWQDEKVKEEEQSDEMINEDHVKIFLVESKMEMTEERCDVKDPIGIPGEKGREGEEGKGEDLDRGVEEANQ